MTPGRVGDLIKVPTAFKHSEVMLRSHMDDTGHRESLEVGQPHRTHGQPGLPPDASQRRQIDPFRSWTMGHQGIDGSLRTFENAKHLTERNQTAIGRSVGVADIVVTLLLEAGPPILGGTRTERPFRGIQFIVGTEVPTQDECVCQQEG